QYNNPLLFIMSPFQLTTSCPLHIIYYKLDPLPGKLSGTFIRMGMTVICAHSSRLRLQGTHL
ncbi:hypothetical protein KA005_72125, partial [bacterium]|nr:hypothetical protein [bacterium]